MKFFVYNWLLLINKFDKEYVTLKQILNKNKTT